MNHSTSHILLLDSENRSSVSTSIEDAVYQLSEHYLHETKSVQFKSICFSNTAYNVTTANNTIAYEVLGVPTTTSIPVGQYDIPSFIVALNTALGGVLVVADLPLVKKFTWTSPGNTQILLAGTTMKRVIGITADTVVGVSYQSNVIYSMIRSYMVHLCSNSLARADNLIKSDKQKYAIIASISLDVGFGFVKFQSEDLDTSDFSLFSGHRNLSTIDLKLLGDDMKILELNGSGYVAQFVLRAE